MRGFKLDQTFFGLSPSDRLRLHDNLFELLWHGEGRWDWDTIYTMPIFLRLYWVRKLNEKLEQKINSTQNKKSKQPSVHRPPKPATKYKQ